MARTPVTGATGFIGGHVVRQLVACGDDVTATVREHSRTTSRRARAWYRELDGDRLPAVGARQPVALRRAGL